MGKGRKITIRHNCQTPTDPSNELYQILEFKAPKRSEMIKTRFEAYTGLPLTWESISVQKLLLFKKHILEDLSINAAATNCAWLASSIRVYCLDHGMNPESYSKALAIRREKGIFVAVNQEEMDALEGFYRKCANTVLRAVAALAIIEYYTGARNSDTEDFTSSNVIEGTYIDKKTGEPKKHLVIAYTSEKTNVKANVPVKPIVREILADEKILGVMIENEVFNRRIKQIFEILGLDREVFEHRGGKDKTYRLCDAVTSHSFRRSFATRLNDRGVNIEMISRMMGHTNTQQTRGYVCGQNLVLDEKAIEFFE